MRQRRVVTPVHLYGYQQPLSLFTPFGYVLDLQVVSAFAECLGRVENCLSGEEALVSCQVRENAPY